MEKGNKYTIFVKVGDKTLVYSINEYKIVDNILIEFFDSRKNVIKRFPVNNVEIEVSPNDE